MKKRPPIFYYRKLHRYLGLIIGIQFIFWTIGGIFFAWSNIDQIHGDWNRKDIKQITKYQDWVSPSSVFEKITEHKVDSIASFKSISFLGKPYYQIKYFTEHNIKTVLANAQTGEVREPLSENEAIQLAINSFTPQSEVKNVKILTNGMVHKHHEYRGRPLPAYAITFEHRSGTTVYVSTELGQVMTFRNSNWRIFDFLWMMHTMDYNGRDHFGNILLKAFSFLSLFTILSGFILYYSSWRMLRKNKRS